ncbi:MAG TPA: hypothetical protein VG248_18360 [Caulobacteraceae bacterium]|jgi:hypothetical protein|nr:hypothetical protein [Caulobacteraceae bacterium]
MSPFKKAIASAAAVAAVAGGTLALSASAADAYVACNRSGDCWHVHDRLTYPADAGVIVHEDGWVFDRPNYYHWRHDRADHGYYYHNHWRKF